jgi:hypothetical protein
MTWQLKNQHAKEGRPITTPQQTKQQRNKETLESAMTKVVRIRQIIELLSQGQAEYAYQVLCLIKLMKDLNHHAKRKCILWIRGTDAGTNTRDTVQEGRRNQLSHRGFESSLRILSMLGGILVFFSMILPWWEVHAFFLSYSISLLSLHPFEIGNVTIALTQTLNNAVATTVILLAVAALLGFAGLRYSWARILGVVLIGIGLVAFASGLAAVLAPFSLYGSMCLFNTCASWGLSWGFYVAMIAASVMGLSALESLWQPTRMPPNPPGIQENRP